MESLEAVRGGKLHAKDSFRVYGEHLLCRLQELHPDTSMFGRLKPVYDNECNFLEKLYFIIAEGKKGDGGFFAGLNPFAKKSRRLLIAYENRFGLGTKRITVHESSLRGDVEQIVTELNKKSGRRFDVKYSAG